MRWARCEMLLGGLCGGARVRTWCIDVYDGDARRRDGDGEYANASSGFADASGG